MAELIVIGYADEQTAGKVLDEVLEMQKDYLIDLANAGVVRRDAKGKLHVSSPHHLTSEGALWGALWGALIGLIFFVPLFGAIVGGAFGALGGKLTELGIDDDFKRQIGDLVKPSTSALMLVVQKATPDKVLDELRPYGGTVLRTSLTEDAERKLQAALAGEQVEAALTD